VFPITLAGCDSSQVQLCEQHLKSKLKSPASYKRIEAESIQIDSSIHKPPYDEVTITYDAANSYNALLRDSETCFYHPGTTDRIENPFAEEVEAEMQKMSSAASQAADDALNAAANAADNLSDAIQEAEDAVQDTPHEVAAPDTAATTSDDSYDVNNDAGE
jgi:hypothetical protein